MSDETCEVVLVNGWAGAESPVRINKSDYDADPSKYTLYDPEPAVAAVPPTPQPPQMPAGTPPTPQPPKRTLMVLSEGRRFFVSDDQGVKQTGEGIDPEGYATKAAAQAAIANLG